MDSADQLSAEVNQCENYPSQQSSSSSSSSNINNNNNNNGQATHDLLGKIKYKRKPIFKLMKRSNIRKKCSSLPGSQNRRSLQEGIMHNQVHIQECQNSILNLPQNLSLEQNDSSINNNPSQNNLDDDDLFSFNGSFCQSPPFADMKDYANRINNVHKMELSDQLSDIKASSNLLPFNSLSLQLFAEDKHQQEQQQQQPNNSNNNNVEINQNNKNIDLTQSLMNKKKKKNVSNIRHSNKVKRSKVEQEELQDINLDKLSESPLDTESIQLNTLEQENNLSQQDLSMQKEQERNNSPLETNNNHNFNGNSPHADNSECHKQQYSRREKSLEELSKKFLTIFLQKEQMMISLDKITQQLDVERRRIYDIINILESLKLVTRRGKNNYKWNGFDQIFDTIQFFNTQNEVQDDTITIEQNEKKEKSLEILSIGFLKLFLNYKQTLSLEEAARKLSPNNSENQKIKTKIRRLYDIANVFKSLGLIKKVQLNETKKPAFQWVGISGLQEFYNSSKEQEDIQVNLEMEEKKKIFKQTKKEQVVKQPINSNKINQKQNNINQNNQFDQMSKIEEVSQQQKSSYDDDRTYQSQQESQQGQNLEYEHFAKKSSECQMMELNQNDSQKPSPIKSIPPCGFLSNSKNSAFKRVSKSLTDPTQTQFNNSGLKQQNLNQVLENQMQNSTLMQCDASSQVKRLKTDQNNHKEEDEEEVEQEEEENISTSNNAHKDTSQFKYNLKNQNTSIEQKHLSEERELITLLEKMRLQNLITDKNDNLTNAFKQNLNAQLHDNSLATADNTGMLVETNHDNQILFQQPQTSASKISNSTFNSSNSAQSAALNSTNTVFNYSNTAFNSTNSAFNMTNKNKRRIEDKGINSVNKESGNSNTLLSLFSQLNPLSKIENKQIDQNNENSKQELINKQNSQVNTQEMIIEQLGDQSNSRMFNINSSNRLTCLESVVRNQILSNNSFNQSKINQNHFNSIFGHKETSDILLSLSNPSETNQISQISQINQINGNNNINYISSEDRKEQQQQSSQNENSKKEVINRKKQKTSFDRYNSIIQNANSTSTHFKDHQDHNNSSNTNLQTINHKKDKFKTKSNSFYDDRKALSEQERLLELVKFNRDEDQLFFSPKQPMQCIKKRKKGQEDIISTSVSSNQSSDSKTHSTTQFVSAEQFTFSAPLQPQQQQQQLKILQLRQQQQQQQQQSQLQQQQQQQYQQQQQ